MKSSANPKSIFITGANGGLGIETTQLLVKNGTQRIVMACRTSDKAIAARQQVIQTTHLKDSTRLEAIGGFDMNDPAKIETVVNALPANKPFDVVFLQAGGVIFTDDYEFVHWNGTKIEKTVFQNVFGAYITLYHLKKRGLIAPGARVVFAGGEGARGIKGLIDKPVFNSAQALQNYLLGKDAPKYNPMNAIGVSKLMSALLTIKLASLNKDLDFVWFSPGLTYGTNGLHKLSKVKQFVMGKLVFGLMALLGKAQNPKKGAQKYVNALQGKIGKNGDVIGAPEGVALGKLTDQKPMNAAFNDVALQNEFWNILESVCGKFEEVAV